MVEILTAVGAIISYNRFGLSINTIICFFIYAVLLYISFVDFDTMEISNLSLIFLFVLSIAFYFTNNELNLRNTTILFLNGIISCNLILIIFIVTKGNGMGFGDVLLSFAVGINFSPKEALLFNFLSFVIGAFYSVVFLLTSKEKDIKRKPIAFGPMICLSSFLVLLYGNDILKIYIDLFLS